MLGTIIVLFRIESLVKTVFDLLANNCIIKVLERPFICSPVSIVDGPSKEVINLKHLNIFYGNKSLNGLACSLEKGDMVSTFYIVGNILVLDGTSMG